MKFYKLENKLIFFESQRPKGELKDWLIKNSFNPNKYIECSLPSILLFYLDDDNVKTKNIELDRYNINNINIENLETINTIYIFKSEYLKEEEIRLYPVIAGDDYVRWLRKRKLKRILYGS